MQIIFPIYRIFKNERHFYKILSDKEFIQIDKVGSQYVQVHKVVNNFFDVQFIQDMIENKNGHYLESNSREYNKIEDLLN